MKYTISKIIRKLVSVSSIKVQFYFAYFFHYRELRKVKEFCLRDVKKGFTDRTTNKYDNLDTINRIIIAYNKSKNDQANKSSEYQIGDEWIVMYNRYMGKIQEIFKENDSDQLMKSYKNFMREDFSGGLHGMPVNMKTKYFGSSISTYNKRRYLIDVIYRHKLWKKLIGNECVTSDKQIPDIGNPYGFYFDNIFIRNGSEYHHYYANYINRLTKSLTSSKKVVFEIGGGFGGMAYFLLKNSNAVKYIDVDLPENMALTSYYLISLFPEKKILLYGENELTPEIFEKYDIIILPNYAIESIPDNYCNVSFNSYSLAEMSKETISKYISHLMRITNNYILHVNHNKNSTIIADDFGIDPATFNLMYKIPALWNFGRNIKMDEYEYLYKKY